jgi:hypothetical protein
LFFRVLVFNEGWWTDIETNYGLELGHQYFSKKQKRMNVKQWSMQWAGRTLSVETGKFSLQANASCTVRYGDTVLLATAVMSKNTRDGIDFFPLMVNFEEKLYAAGKIKGSRFIKREGRPSEEAILSGRLVDRAIRPLFDQNMRNDVQVILTALSYDGENDPQIPAMIAASIALSLSNIPWGGPIAAARVGRVADLEGHHALPLGLERSDVDDDAAAGVGGLAHADRQHVAGDLELLHRLGQGEAVGRDDAVVGVDGDKALGVEVLGVDQGGVQVGEDLELARHADVVAVAGNAVADDAFAHLLLDEGLDHAVLLGQLGDGDVGQDAQGFSLVGGVFFASFKVGAMRRAPM